MTTTNAPVGSVAAPAAAKPSFWDRSLGPVVPAARVLVLCAIALMTLGLVIVHSASTTPTAVAIGDSTSILRRHGAWVLLATITLFLTMRIDLEWLKRRARPLMIVAMVLLALVLIPGVGTQINGARRWFRIGVLSFQPSEVAKLALVIWLATHVARNSGRLGEWRTGTLPALVPLAVCSALILVEPDFGTALFIGAVGAAMLLVGGVPVRRMATLALAAAPLLAWQVVARWDVFVRRFSAVGSAEGSTDAAYQVRQGLIALGSGGLWGRGLGAGRQKLFFLPEARTDFILPVIGEELGFLGTAAVVVMFGVMVVCGLRIALGAARSDRFAFLLSFGLVFWIGLQAAGNVAVVTASVPTKGIALPFISVGGSSLVALAAAVGLIYACARRVDARGVRLTTAVRPVRAEAAS